MRNFYWSAAITVAFTAALGLPADAHAKAALATVQSWTGSTGYVYGRPHVSATGVVYGVLAVGGSSQAGTVYALTKSGTTYTPTTISTFTGGSSGGFPVGGLLPANTGSTLYGAAAAGGMTGTNCVVGTFSGCGLIYSLTPPASGTTWTRTTIYTFQGGTDGSQPTGDLIMDSSGAIYGTATNGGCTRTLAYGSGCGIVFKLTPPSSGTTWIETVLYRFQGGTDGANPAGGFQYDLGYKGGGPLAMDASGNIYGTTTFGGAEKCTLVNGSPDSRCGTVFKLTKSGSTYTESILYSFQNGADGSLPAPGLAMSSKGVLYGAATAGGNESDTCAQSGNSGCGTVFSLTPAATGTTYTEATLLSFSGKNGASPVTPILDGAGKLYGEASMNSTADSKCPSSIGFYCGTIYELKPSGTKFKASTVYSFTGGATNAGPILGLTADASGNLWGTALEDVTSTVFELTGAGYTVP